MHLQTAAQTWHWAGKTAFCCVGFHTPRNLTYPYHPCIYLHIYDIWILWDRYQKWWDSENVTRSFQTWLRFGYLAVKFQGRYMSIKGRHIFLALQHSNTPVPLCWISLALTHLKKNRQLRETFPPTKKNLRKNHPNERSLKPKPPNESAEILHQLIGSLSHYL